VHASAVPVETGNPEFSLKCCIFATKHTKHILKYHLITAEPPFTVKTIDRVQQTERMEGSVASCSRPMLPSLPLLCRSLWQKWLLFFIEHEVNVNGQYCWDSLLSQQMLDVWTHRWWHFVFQQDSAPVHHAFNTVQLLQCKLSTSFLLTYDPITVQSLRPMTTRSMKFCISSFHQVVSKH